jgi:hypothetical protein
MSSIIDRTIDPQSGLVTDIGFEDGKMKVRYMQDASPLHAQNQRMREADDYTKLGIRKGFMHTFSMSAADCAKMIVEDGVNPYTATPAELNAYIFSHREKWGHCIVTKAQIGRAGR